jgi:hypothetical protein
MSASPVINPASPTANTPNVLRPAAVPRSPRWFVKRAVIGTAMLIGFAFGGAMLLDASIDRTADTELPADAPN